MSRHLHPAAWCPVILVAALLANAAWTADEPPAPSDPAPAPAPAGAPAPPQPQPPVQPPAAGGMTPAEYVAAGLPAPDRTWQAPELETAARTLATLYQKDPSSLPRRGHPRSGLVFHRLFAPENGDLGDNAKLPIQSRLAATLACVASTRNIVQFYLQEAQQGKDFGPELVDGTGACLRQAVRLVRLLDEFLPTLDPQDPSYANRMAGLKKMRDGLATMASGAFLMLGERETYGATDRARLCGFLQETLPVLTRQMPDLTLQEMRRRAADLVAAEADPACQAALAALAASLVPK